tara:strand:- start:7260 stop:8243 length:984 start_codon:yes stop_codon:yes gene_type:complete
MIKISYDEIVSKIKEKSDLTDKDIETKVEEKLKQLSGLISKEGAAHIVANESGVKLFEQVSGRLQIKNVLVGMRDVEVLGKVLQLYEVREFNSGERSGKVGSLIIGDETENIRVVLWGDQTDNLAKVKVNDVVKVLGGYVRANQGGKEIQLNDRAQFIINPEGEVVEATVKITKTRKLIKDLKEGDGGVEILGTVVQVFEPRFYEVCPECGKRARPSEGNFMCNTHNAVAPNFSYVLNAVIDDGTETIRAAFFREGVEKLLNKKPEDLLMMKEDPSKFLESRDGIQGKIIKVEGRVNKNEMFDRIEFVANEVDVNPNPEEELKRLES